LISHQAASLSRIFHLGIDVGSTTVKLAVLDVAERKLLLSRYERHRARQAETVKQLLEDLREDWGDARFRIAVCGSGGIEISRALGAFFIQEVVANALAVREYHGSARTAIELGGQDAKVVFFEPDPRTGRLAAADLRMNGVCAGGTGAFIDQMAELLSVRPEEMGALAERGRHEYPISGRCGVFAKTDLQPLLNQGVPAEDLALSTFHAIAKQTIGGLAQGAEIRPPVVFEGGPLTFNPKLVSVFSDRLGLGPEDIIVPEHAEVVVAMGAALAADPACSQQDDPVGLDVALERLAAWQPRDEQAAAQAAYFASDAERREFRTRHRSLDWQPAAHAPGDALAVYIGVDAGSTTSKFVLIDEAGNLVDRYYRANGGDPLGVVVEGLRELHARHGAAGVRLEILGVGTTGYGERLLARALRADYHTVETVAHAKAALRFAPDASFILDIGGQDMKAISLRGGIVTSIVLNEACSAGCGSFLETYARSLGIPTDEIARLAFASTSPSRLGSRCTVFMNSSIVTEQRNGKEPADIMAGLCRSIIENVFTKVVRVPNFDQLGRKVVVQGGTFKNDAVLRAFEQFTGRSVVRAPFPGEMGAYGIALLTCEHMRGRPAGARESSFIGWEALEAFAATKLQGANCVLCTNNCSRGIVRFSTGDRLVTGNRCEKGEVLGDPRDRDVLKRIKEISAKQEASIDLFKVRNKLLAKDYAAPQAAPRRPVRIGLPLTLEFWHSLPFWKALFSTLGFEVVVSDRSSYPLFEAGLPFVPSDTVCFPAKLVHGHVRNLIQKRVDRIFMPTMIAVKVHENHTRDTVNMCAVVQGYPLVIRHNDDPERHHGVVLDSPTFQFRSARLRDAQLRRYLREAFSVDSRLARRAVAAADAAQAAFQAAVEDAGRRVLASLEGTGRFAVILAGRPYHHDDLVHHGIAGQFTDLGIPVLTIDSLPGLDEVDLSDIRVDRVNPFHARLFAAAKIAAGHPNLQMAQLVSFGCGHDAVITDEIARILDTVAGKQLLALKIDEGEALGPLGIRIKSFVETVRSGMPDGPAPRRELAAPFEVKYTEDDRKLRTILAPNVSESFAAIASGVLRSKGYRIAPLPMADETAKMLGKRYVHNDICYPAQINVGEFLAVLERGEYQPSEVALGLAKNCDDCRAGQYAVLARKALDEAGYPGIPIVTTGVDRAEMHPGLKLGTWFQLGMLYGLAIADALDEMARRLRPYEVVPGETDDIFRASVADTAEALVEGHGAALAALERAVARFNRIAVAGDPKPRVLIIGEILLNFHPTANEQMVRYFETHGLEVVLPSVVDFFRRDLLRLKAGIAKNHLPNPLGNWAVAEMTDWMYERVLGQVNERVRAFRGHERRPSIHELAALGEQFADRTYVVGEGWLIPAEISAYAQAGVSSFVVVQPFGCLPNHISGRGMFKALRRRFPDIRIIALDFDADGSFANVENRLQMLIMSQRAARGTLAPGAASGADDRQPRQCTFS